LENDDAEKVREVYKACLDVIPHKSFTFAKVWLLFAQFEIRQKNLQGARNTIIYPQVNISSPMSLFLKILNCVHYLNCYLSQH
jgi:hypothetical protein